MSGRREVDRHAAFESILRQHEKLVLRVAWRLLGRWEDAQDAAQEVFLKLYRNMDRIEDPERPGAWLYKVTLNVCRDIGRRRKPVEPIVVEPASGGASAFDGLEQEDRLQMLTQGLETLAERERQALVLRDIEGLPGSEVAAIMGTAEVTVRGHIAAARLKLKKFIEQRERRARQ